jgi:hypothetical protein
MFMNKRFLNLYNENNSIRMVFISDCALRRIKLSKLKRKSLSVKIVKRFINFMSDEIFTGLFKYREELFLKIER